jgi:hypothetical protein
MFSILVIDLKTPPFLEFVGFCFDAFMNRHQIIPGNEELSCNKLNQTNCGKKHFLSFKLSVYMRCRFGTAEGYHITF